MKKWLEFTCDFFEAICLHDASSRNYTYPRNLDKRNWMICICTEFDVNFFLYTDDTRSQIFRIVLKGKRGRDRKLCGFSVICLFRFVIKLSFGTVLRACVCVTLRNSHQWPRKMSFFSPARGPNCRLLHQFEQWFRTLTNWRPNELNPGHQSATLRQSAAIFFFYQIWQPRTMKARKWL